MQIGYARVSTYDQNLDLQKDALQKAGCDRIIEWVNYLEDKGVGFKSLQESIDTSTSTGKLIFHIFGALAEFERNLIRERTNAGLKAARARGRLGGRPQSLDDEKRQTVAKLYNDGKLQVMEICEMFNISKPTLYKYVKQAKENK